jgi:hypothetical protein
LKSKGSGIFKMKLADFKMIEKDYMPGGFQSLLSFGEHHQLSVISGEGAYGSKNAPYEIAVFINGEFANLPGIVEDDVKGYLTESEVDTIIKKLHTITKAVPVQMEI